MEETIRFRAIRASKPYKILNGLIKNSLFKYLPFEMLFPFMVLFRHYTKKNSFDEQIKFHYAEKLKNHPKILNSLIAKKYPETTQLLLRHAFPDSVWISQLHITNWDTCSDTVRQDKTTLLHTMLEHRGYSFEDSRLKKILHHNSRYHFENLPFSEYCTHFFIDRETSDSLINELNLEKSTLDTKKLQDNKITFSSGNVSQFNDIQLFYAYRQLAGRAYHQGEGHFIPKIAQKMECLQKRLRLNLPSPSPSLQKFLDDHQIHYPDLKIFSADWTALIGHNGHLNVNFMMQKMGWWEGAPVILAYPKRIANSAFLTLFEAYCPVLHPGKNISENIWNELASLMPFFDVSLSAFTFKDGRSMFWTDAGSMAVHEWESQYGETFPLRDIYDAHPMYEEGENKLTSLKKKWGMQESDWYVCLHIRDSETRNEQSGAGEAIRCASFENYVKAVQHITDQGGWVIRMGGNKAPKLPSMPKLIDYAHSPDAEPLLDIHLMRKAKIFIGGISGLFCAAYALGIPLAMVNIITSNGLMWSRNTRFIVKPVYTKEGRMLTQRELTDDKYRWAFPTHEALIRENLRVEENSEDEILETVKEVLSLANHSKFDHQNPLLDKWQSQLCIPTFYGSAKPSHYFLEKYEHEFLRE